MKVHYINILLFALPLYILEHNQRNHKIPIPHTPCHIQTNRSLCECDLYIPNYDNDPQMKLVIDNFNKQTQQRLEEYNERIKTTRRKCKEQCDKEIQKIILKDKLEKELMDKFATLHTDIKSDAIPTCVCEKSLADKTEKFCLNCGKTMGGFVPGYWLVSGLWYVAWTNYVPIAVAKAAMDAGMEVVNQVLLKQLGIQKIPDVILKGISSINDFSKVKTFADIIQKEFMASCVAKSPSSTTMCALVNSGSTRGVTAERLVSGALDAIVTKAPGTAKAAKRIEAANYASTTSSLTTGISASILAIEIIVLIMVIRFRV
ncbi:rifin [Plasmodium reichenowi]|uniref:Rifin n=1 Tax=Plasmodium reichenowi TaxID=5854 RepID=A0A060RMM2_PLARE|nr:rifin [Plasmodium reichenowi]